VTASTYRTDIIEAFGSLPGLSVLMIEAQFEDRIVAHRDLLRAGQFDWAGAVAQCVPDRRGAEITNSCS
jgi:hypothetical protein